MAALACTSLSARAAVGGPRLAVRRQAAAAPAPVATQITAVQVLEGKCVSSAGMKTAVVLVSRKVPHPKYIKLMNKSSRFQVHDEDNLCKVGDVVRFEACRPMSKSKRFVVKTIAGAAVYPDGVDGVGLKAK